MLPICPTAMAVGRFLRMFPSALKRGSTWPLSVPTVRASRRLCQSLRENCPLMMARSPGRGVRRLDTWTSTRPLRRERPSAKRCARPFRILSMRKRKCLPLTIRWHRLHRTSWSASWRIRPKSRNGWRRLITTTLIQNRGSRGGPWTARYWP